MLVWLIVPFMAGSSAPGINVINTQIVLIPNTVQTVAYRTGLCDKFLLHLHYGTSLMK